ncbi:MULTISPECIES: hypothetical protein [Vibrio]|uniref:Uncharacterized protein n=1 Tax=Photobacterium sp. (strain ATCC 43367) TaxID=379097 RepID=A0A0A5JGI2_PHOS4|nr:MULTISPECIES: hypothetical protein [Vibrio]EKO3808004.1 hypothetical protein [Vibrio harveyi]KGY07063.1 hypothetical protein NM06_19115 [Vibrio sinaloensis]
MDKDLIKAIAQEIVSDTIFNNYQIYVVIIAISVISAAITSLVSSYYKKRGEDLATKANQQDIVAHLEVTTEAAEKVKAVVAKELQEQLGHKVLLREKLEAIFSHTFELELWLEKSRTEAFKKISPDINDSPLSKIEMYQAIYFCEVSEELKDLQSAYYPVLTFVLKIAMGQTGVEKSEVDEFTEVHTPFLGSLQNFRAALLQKYSPQAGL